MEEQQLLVKCFAMRLEFRSHLQSYLQLNDRCRCSSPGPSRNMRSSVTEQVFLATWYYCRKLLKGIALYFRPSSCAHRLVRGGFVLEHRSWNKCPVVLMLPTEGAHRLTYDKLVDPICEKEFCLVDVGLCPLRFRLGLLFRRACPFHTFKLVLEFTWCSRRLFRLVFRGVFN